MSYTVSTLVDLAFAFFFGFFAYYSDELYSEDSYSDYYENETYSSDSD